jgi:glyoxylase-like metal-dependent hydrolase (beta-lactamase superfamily II)
VPIPHLHFVCGVLLTQAGVSPVTVAQQDHRARALVQRALERLQPAAGPVQRLIIEAEGTEDLAAEVQGLAPARETRRSHRDLLVIDLAAGAVAYERRTPRTDYSLRWRRFILFPDQRGVVDLANGFGVMRPAAVADADRAAYRRRVPHFLLREVLDSAGALRWLTPNRSGARVAAVLPGGTEFVLSFDEASQLVRVDYPLEFPGLGDTRAAIEYHGWHPHPQLARFPSGHRILLGSHVYQDVEYRAVRTDDTATGEYLAIPPELDRPRRATPTPPSRPMPPASPPGTVAEIAEGIYLVANLGGFQLMFVDLGGEVVAFDAPAAHPFLDAMPATNYSAGAAPLSRDYVRLIQHTLPGIPIRYVIISHHHSDHVGGVRDFLAAGATVISAPEDSALIHRMAEAPHTLKSGLPAGARPRIEVVRDRRVITGRVRSVEVRAVGANPHSDANLVLWLPASRVLMQGDLFYHFQGEPPPPDRDTMNRFFSRWLRGERIEPERIYGVHNSGYATIADLPGPS